MSVKVFCDLPGIVQDEGIIFSPKNDKWKEFCQVLSKVLTNKRPIYLYVAGRFLGIGFLDGGCTGKQSWRMQQ